MRPSPIRPLHEILEKDWDRDLFSKTKGLAPLLGWDSYWTYRSKGSRAGFPDRTVVRDRILYAELKRELTGKKSEDANRQPSAEQIEWLDKLAKAGGEVYLWRPSDQQEIADILGRWHWQATSTHSVRGRTLSSPTRPEWRPKSLWIPGVGRADTVHQPEQQSLLTEGAAA